MHCFKMIDTSFILLECIFLTILGALKSFSQNEKHSFVTVMTECSLLTELPADLPLVTDELYDDLIVDNYSRTVGTTVNVRCQPKLVLVGPSTIRCMQSGSWSAEPHCASPSELTTAHPTSDADDTIILVAVLAVVGFLLAALIIFVFVAMLWGRNKRYYRKSKRFRGSTEFYMEDGSSQPYSISRKTYDSLQMYHQHHLRVILTNRDVRRDGYLWKRRSSSSDLNIPRPYYEITGTPQYVLYYGRNTSPYV